MSDPKFVVLLTFHLSFPSHLPHFIPDCNVFPSLHIFVRNSSLLRPYGATDRSLPPLFPFPFSDFSFFFFHFCAFFLLLFITCSSNFPRCIFHLVAFPQQCSPFHIHLFLPHHHPPPATRHRLLFFSFFFLCLQHWLTELEIFAMIFAAAVHDYEHTGTTNNFHIQTR